MKDNQTNKKTVGISPEMDVGKKYMQVMFPALVLPQINYLTPEIEAYYQFFYAPAIQRMVEGH